MTTLALLMTAPLGQSIFAAVPAPIIPKGATVGTSGHATIRVAPPSPTGDVKSRRPTYRTVSEWYAQENGLSLAAARTRMAGQQALQPVFERLRHRLSQAEPNNYVDARLVHQPDWGYVLYFKRDPEATLRKYSVNPRFKGAGASYTRAELEKLLAPWARRFAEANILGFYTANGIESRVEMSIAVTAQEYHALAKAKGWGEVPAPIKLNFPGDLPFPRVDPRIANLLRGFAS